MKTSVVDQKKEGFVGQKMFVVPANIRKVIKEEPLINTLYFTDVGYYPQAVNHFRERKKGCAEYILIYCIEGEGLIETGNQSHVMTPNSFFIIPRYTSHSYGAKANSWSIYWLHFAGVRAESLYDKYQQEFGNMVAGIPLEKKRIHLFDDIFSLLESGYSTRNVEYVNLLLWQLLSSFIYSSLGKEVSRGEIENRIEKSVRYMREHLDQPLRIEEIASRYNYSVSQFFSSFKENTGYSPLQYFNQMKVQEACQYLSFTQMSVKEISFKVGFEDPHYFSRIFKKLMGISPLQYRNSYS